MPGNHSQANQNWRVQRDDGSVSQEQARLAVAMDIRHELQSVKDEIQKLNTLLHCDNFVKIPQILRAIRRNTAKKPRKKT